MHRIPDLGSRIRIRNTGTEYTVDIERRPCSTHLIEKAKHMSFRSCGSVCALAAACRVPVIFLFFPRTDEGEIRWLSLSCSQLGKVQALQTLLARENAVNISEIHKRGPTKSLSCCVGSTKGM
jgi:hypothetical protein